MGKLWVIAVSLLIPVGALAQTGEPEPRVIVVPYPGADTRDGGYNVAPEPPPPPGTQGNVYPPNTYPPPQQQNPNYPPPQQQDPNYPPPPPQPPGTIIAQPPPDEPPPALPPENLIPPNPPPSRPSAMLDGHPREGAFLSGPGSMAFILHHTLLGLFAGVGTQLAPRVQAVNRSLNPLNPDTATNQDARLAYLAAGLIGAGLGFGSSAAWQFFNWMSESTAYFGLANSFFGAMFGGGFANFITNDAGAVSWTAWAGALLGAWLTAVVGGGQLANNKGALMMSGAYWATVFAGLICAVLATTGGGNGNLQKGIDAVLIAPGIGAGLMALALLKFNPSTAQVLRADLFGSAAGAVVLIISALVLGANFAHPVPYVLAGVAAAGGIATVSLLWADAAEAPPPPPLSPDGDAPPKQRYDSVW